MTSDLDQTTDPVTLSILRIELLTFFQANPHTRDTADGLALRLHRPKHEIEIALTTLSALGIVEIGGTEKTTIYRLRNGDLINNYFMDKLSEKPF
ncbi:hypothetical protein SPSYN_01169 [Sporotomaculum syntrophicum]|uniref:Uncharacterized protein n=1 Tax=Sporotomaculum syntrophicum TaxID=182264 RepID=A0A9D3AYR2_9FIRM|nr:hypothetical protein [Sporotomaculum syntrophicum]KAF1085033.1 hypothetical protein SPSYN_01169 [Sporotomaculum syntrophicum]